MHGMLFCASGGRPLAVERDVRPPTSADHTKSGFAAWDLLEDGRPKLVTFAREEVDRGHLADPFR